MLGARWRGLIESWYSMSDGFSLFLTPFPTPRPPLGGDRRLRGRLRLALDPPAPGVQHRPLRPREHGADGLEHRARPLPADDERRRPARSPASPRTSTRSSPPFAPLWWIWPSPEMLLTVQAIVVALGALPVFWLARKHLGIGARGARLRARLPALPGDRVADAERVPPGRARLPVPPLRVSGTSTRTASLPFAVFAALAMTTKEEIGLVVAGLGVWYAIRRRPRRTGGDRRGRGLARLGARDRRRHPALQRRRRLVVLRPLRRDRRLGRRDREDGRHPPVDGSSSRPSSAATSTTCCTCSLPLALPASSSHRSSSSPSCPSSR